jgi:predicted oxidoreductase
MTNGLPIHEQGLQVSQLILGCMGFGGGWTKNPIQLQDVRNMQLAMETALEVGINFFDHADIYAHGKAEQVFGDVLRAQPEFRAQMVIQSKCGIRFGEASSGVPTRYDFSRDHIIASVDGSLSRLGIDYLDVLLLHRPDALMDAVEVGETLALLKAQGKVRYFGVSNMSAGQIQLLQKHCAERLILNQLEMSLAHHGWLDNGVHVNQQAARENTFPEGTLEYCQLEGIQMQAWSPLAKGMFSGADVSSHSDSVHQTAQLVQRLAGDRGVSPEAIVLAWLMRHPAKIQPVVGTTNVARIRACAQAGEVVLSREEWYALYVSARGVGLP